LLQQYQARELAEYVKLLEVDKIAMEEAITQLAEDKGMLIILLSKRIYDLVYLISM
jgi:hypothetical protein